jgi:hypothetical protein
VTAERDDRDHPPRTIGGTRLRGFPSSPLGTSRCHPAIFHEMQDEGPPSAASRVSEDAVVISEPRTESANCYGLTSTNDIS